MFGKGCWPLIDIIEMKQNPAHLLISKGSKKREHILDGKAVVHPAQVLVASRKVPTVPTACILPPTGLPACLRGVGGVAGWEDLAHEVASLGVRSQHRLGLHSGEHPVVPPARRKSGVNICPKNLKLSRGTTCQEKIRGKYLSKKI